MILVIVEWTVPLLMALILQRMWTEEIPKERLYRGLKWSLAVVGGIILFFLLLGGSLFSFESAVDAQMPQEVAAAMRTERAEMLRADAWRSLLLVMAAAVVMWLYAGHKIKKSVTTLWRIH